jgi:hypothetical protein
MKSLEGVDGQSIHTRVLVTVSDKFELSDRMEGHMNDEERFCVTVTIGVYTQEAADKDGGPLVEVNVDFDGQEWKDVLTAIRMACSSAQIKIRRKIPMPS